MSGSRFSITALTVLVVGTGAVACGPDETTFLDHRAILESFDWWDNRDWDWYEENIPFFESPDPVLDATYYYRWEVLTKHLVYGSPETGYTLTEFIDRPHWSGAYGAISCPLGHQAYEIRWLKDRRIIDDFARYWFETPGAEPRSYSNWYGDAMWATYAVLADTSFLRRVYPHMRAQVDGWTSERWDPEHRMYRWVGAWDGMETNINSRLTDDPFGGGEGYRPTLNSYLFGDLMALARAARVFGEVEEARGFQARAQELKARVQEELWDPERQFFFHQFANDERGGIRGKTLTYASGPHAGDPHGRELIGYVPWQFNLPDSGYEAAWAFLPDPERFWAPFGPTTVEKGDPQYFVSPNCCVWSGNAWPYATTQTLKALANLLNNYEQDILVPADFFAQLSGYARSHRLDGRPYVAEAADPETGSWTGHNTFYHSEHYLHSGFIDLVVTGLMGLRPRSDDTLEVNPLGLEEWPYMAVEGVSYHGHDLAILWDRDGTRYGKGPGLTLVLNGEVVAQTPRMQRIRVDIPAPVRPEAKPRLHNFAVNNDGRHFPVATASSFLPVTPPFYAVDGNRWYHPSPPNRWVAFLDQGDPSGEGKAERSDWFVLDFGVSRKLQEIRLHFLDDGPGYPQEATGEEGESGFPMDRGAEGPPILPPARYDLQAWNGEAWTEIPSQTRRPLEPTGRQANRVTFPELSAARVRVLLHHQPGATSGFTEIEAWGSEGLPLTAPTAPVRNMAWNPGDQESPRVRASFTASSDDVQQAVDGQIALTRYSRNRWTAYGSPNRTDWLEVDLGEVRTVARVELFLFADGGGVAAPADYRVQLWLDGRWQDVDASRVPEEPLAWALNMVRIEPTETSRVRVVFSHALPQASGVSELRIWPE